MSALSFVVLELQTTHLDPASVSQASYVKLVNGNITLVDEWPVIPPTAGEATGQTAADDAKSWHEALSHLNMMVGQLPVVSYYRDADKEVFQAASHQIEEAAPEFHWLDCRELARTLLPDLPEFQLSTVLQALDLFDEYGDSNSVEQTTQIVVELARRENAATVEQLWGDLYNQPDRILGLDGSIQSLGSETAATLPSQDVDELENQAEEPEDPISSQDDGGEAQVVVAADGHVEEPENFLEVEAEEPQHDAHPEVATPAPMEADTQAEQQPLTQPIDTVAGSMTDPEPPEDRGGNESASQHGPDADSIQGLTHLEVAEPANAETELSSLDTEPAASPSISAEDREYSRVDADQQLVSDAEADAATATTSGSASYTPVDTRTAAPSPEAVDIPRRPASEQRGPKKSGALRVLGFLGVFGFGLLSVVGLILTIMAVMLFFTENELLLETKIAGTILTGAICLLSLLMTVMSFQSFRKNS